MNISQQQKHAAELIFGKTLADKIFAQAQKTPTPGAIKVAMPAPEMPTPADPQAHFFGAYSQKQADALLAQSHADRQEMAQEISGLFDTKTKKMSLQEMLKCLK